MSRDLKSADDWHDEFDQIRDSITKARSVVEGLRSPAEIPEALRALAQELRSIEELCSNLNGTFVTIHVKDGWQGKN